MARAPGSMTWRCSSRSTRPRSSSSVPNASRDPRPAVSTLPRASSSRGMGPRTRVTGYSTSAAHQGHGALVLPAQDPRPDPGQDVQHGGHDDKDQQEHVPAGAEPVQQRGGDQHDGRGLAADPGEQQHGQVPGRLGQHRLEPGGGPVPVALAAAGQFPRPGPGHAHERHLGTRAQPGPQRQCRRGDDQPPHGGLTPSLPAPPGHRPARVADPGPSARSRAACPAGRTWRCARPAQRGHTRADAGCRACRAAPARRAADAAPGRAWSAATSGQSTTSPSRPGGDVGSPPPP